MKKRKCKSARKRFAAFGLILSLILSDSSLAFAESGQTKEGPFILGSDITQDTLRKALKEDEKLYPEGRFEFFLTQLTVEEGEKQQLVIVRRGGTEKEASVDFKAVDISASYGEDYLLTVEESEYVTRTLEGGGKPLTDFNRPQMPAIENTDNSKDSGKREETTPSDGTGKEQSLDESVQEGLKNKKESKSPLKQARDAYLGTDTDNLNWQELDEAHRVSAEKQSEDYQKALDEFSEDIYGQEYTFTFKKGEYMKSIYIDAIDDEISESDEQVMFLLGNATYGEAAGSRTAYLNIKDNDEGEKAVFAMAANEIIADRSEGVARITVKRVSGADKIASVIVGTGSKEAVSGTDYKAVQKEVLFAQGVTEQAVEIPLLNYEGAPASAQFQVALDANSSYVQEGAAITTVTLTNRTSSAETKQRGNSGASVAAAAGWSDVRNLNVNAKVSGRQDGWSGRKQILSGLDLSTADYIEVTWRSNEGSTTCQETVKSGCKKKTIYNTYNNRRSYLYLNDEAVVSDGSFFPEKTVTIRLNEGKKKTNANLKLEVHTEGKNQNAAAYVTRVSIHYPGYKFTVSNTKYTDNGYSNYYTEKIYTDSADALKKDDYGHKYKEGNSIPLGTLQISRGDGKFQDSVTVYRPCDKLVFRTEYSKNKNSNGVQVQQGASGNVYLAGYQLMQSNSKSWSPLIAPEDLKFTTAFLNQYKSYIFSGNEFRIRAVYWSYDVRVMFQNADPSKGSYANNFKLNEVFRCTTLDTIQVTGIAKTGYSVSGFNLGVHKDTHVHNAANSANTLAAKANAYYRQSQKTIESEAKRVSASSYPKSSISNAVANKAITNVITFTPTGEFVYICPTYSVPKIKVKIDPKNNAKEKGSVIYKKENSDGTVDEDDVQMGDYKTPMEINGVTLNQEYTINAVTEEKYKAYFKDFTGDADEDGRITAAEEQVVAPYNFVRTASNGNAYVFRPVLDNSLIYYGFLPTVANRYEGYIDGVVQLRDKPVFGKKETVKPVNGAQVSVAGQTTVSRYDEASGGVNENGGDGYFSIASKDFVAGENQTVNVTYNNLHLTATQAVNAAAIYELDAYDTIGINGADAYRVNGEEKEAIEVSSIANGDQMYRFVIQTYSKNDTLRARKAVFRFYRKDGTRINNIEQEIISDNGVFLLDFNPAVLSIPVGTSMTVQFEDQNGTVYYEHEMGVTFAQSLGILSFLSSFHFGGAEKAIEIVGVIDSSFHFGWDGNIDDIAANSDDDNTKTISIGFEKEFSNDDDDDGKKEPDKKEAVKEAAKNSGTSSEQKERQKKAADDAITKDGKDSSKNTTEAEIGSASVKLAFGLEINIVKSQDPLHLNEWYFKDMTLAATVEGGVEVSITYMTPIGLPILIGISTGGEGAATFVVEQNYDKKEYYFSDLKDKDAAKIDIFNFNMNHADRAFDAYGIFAVAPYLDLSAGAGFDFLNLMVGGRADFDMNFYTRKDQFDRGDVTFSAYISLKALFFTKTWELASTRVNMFEGARGVNGIADDTDYTYMSLSEMETDSRPYRKNRSGWKGEELLRKRDTADSRGMTETLLEESVNPDPDIKVLNLPDHQYLAVFLDDTPGEDTYNCTHVYYSIWSGGRWSQPELIEKDGTLDDEPAVFDLGERGIYVAWSSADRILNQNDSVIDSLNSMNIHGAFFDVTSQSFGEVQEITKTAPYSYVEGNVTMADNTADVKPHISYDENTGQMLLFYTKTEYTSTAEDDQGLIGDIAKPYSLMAYRIYDFATGTWDETYEASEGVSADYQKAWYGQRFLELAPLAVVEEELDDLGFWTKQPEIKPFEKAVYENADGTISENEPIVLESESTTYNGLALYAYILDYDGDQETEKDRDIFLQIYDYNSRQFTHPIMVTTTPDLAESKVKFVRSGDITMLTYLAGNTLYAMTVSAVKNGLKKSEIAGQEFYYIDKSAPAQTVESEEYAYMPPMIVAGDKVKDLAEGSEEESENQQPSIVDYEVASDDDYIYAVWTKRATKVKEGIDPSSTAASDAKNRAAESQIYLARYDWNEEILTEPVQVTAEEGANYGSIGFALEEGGTGKIKLLATKAKSKVETIEGTDETGQVIEKEILTEDTVNKNLIALEFTPVSTLEVQDIKAEELRAGAESYVTMQLHNDGVETLENLTLTAEKEDGTKICEQTIASSGAGEEISEKIYGGRNYPVSFPITLGETEKGCFIQYKVTNASGKALAEGVYKEEIPVQLDVTEFEAVQDHRGTLRFYVHVKNNGRRKTDAEKIQIGRKMEGAEDKYKNITSIQTEPLLPGESAFYTAEYAYGDYSKMFQTFVKEDTGNYEAVTTFRASVNDESESAADQIVMQASKEQRLRMEAVQSVSILDGAYNPVGKSYTMKKGEITQWNTSVESVAYEGSRYEGTDDKTNYDTSNTAGLRVMYTSDNANVLTVYDSGYAEAVGTGKVTVKAYLMPSNNKVTYTTQEGSFGEDNYVSMPEEAIIINSFEVNVEDKMQDNTPGGSKKSLADCVVTLSKSSYHYDGKVKKPDVTVKTKSGSVLVNGSDYQVTYSNGRKNAGSYKVTVTGTGTYTGTVQKTFEIKIFKGKSYKSGNCSYKVTKLPSGKKPGTVTITKGAGKSARTLTVKDQVKIGGKSFQVTAVGAGAFKNYKKAAKAVIGKNVKVIFSNAFAGCNKLKLVTIQSKKISKVDKNAFQNIYKKAVIKVPSSKLKAYKKKLSKKTGVRATMKIKKK